MKKKKKERKKKKKGDYTGEINPRVMNGWMPVLVSNCS